MLSHVGSEMLGGTLYLVGLSQETGDYVENTEPCRLCKRVIINAGLERVVVRRGPGQAEEILVQRWVEAGGDVI